MTKSQLARAVARATGDDHEVIMHRGFSLIDDASPLDDEDLEALIADWDQIEAEEISSSYRHGYAAPSIMRRPVSRNAKTPVIRNSRTARTAMRVRRTISAAH